MKQIEFKTPPALKINFGEPINVKPGQVSKQVSTLSLEEGAEAMELRMQTGIPGPGLLKTVTIGPEHIEKISWFIDGEEVSQSAVIKVPAEGSVEWAVEVALAVSAPWSAMFIIQMYPQTLDGQLIPYTEI